MNTGYFLDRTLVPDTCPAPGHWLVGPLRGHQVSRSVPLAVNESYPAPERI